jgi:hypothetical protein
MTRTVRRSWRGRILTAGCIVAGSLGSLSAQTTTRSQPTRVVVIGCLKRALASAADAKTAGLTITDFRGGPSPTFQLDAEDSRLAPHTNHMLEITGVTRTPSAGAPRTLPTLEVQSVTMLSPTCWPSQDTAKTGSD